MMKNIGKYILKALLSLFGHLPLKVHYANARFLAWLIGDCIGYRRDDVVVNLARSFPEKTYPELIALRKAFYRHFADLIVEAVWFGACTNPERLRKAHIVEFKNPEFVNDIFEKSPGIVSLYSHCGNWELLGGLYYYNYTDRPGPWREENVCVVYRELSSKMWDEIMRDVRFAPLRDKEHFEGYLESKQVIRYAFTHRGEKKIYNMNTDQRPYFDAPDYIRVNFLNRRVETMSGGAALAHKFGMAVLYQRMRIESRGHYSLEYVPICEDASKMSVEDIMLKYYELLEADIREQPENYLWSHRRSYNLIP